MPFTSEEIAAAIKRLGHERLIEESEQRLREPPDGQPWKKLSAAELSTMLAERLEKEQTLQLAAEGLARQRAPSVGGPSWSHGGEHPLTAAVADEALEPLQRRLSTVWTDVSVNLEAPMMLHGVIYVRYSSYTLQTSGTQLFEALARNTAMILLDYEDQISTVSARADEDALFIGTSWAGVLGSSLSPVELTLSPSLEHEELSPTATQMLEAVYGRIASEAAIINVDKIWTKRKDPETPVTEQWARGQDNHILLDEDVRRCLTRGDDVTGLAFQIDWTYKGRRGEQHYISHVTISSQRGPLILHVTRAGHPFELASALYQAIRRALSRNTSPDRLREVQRVMQEDIMGSAGS